MGVIDYGPDQKNVDHLLWLTKHAGAYSRCLQDLDEACKHRKVGQVSNEIPGRTYADLVKRCVPDGLVPPAPGDAAGIATLWAEFERLDKSPGRDDLAFLRLMLISHETRAEDYRAQAAEYGVRAVNLARRIADLPCDIERTHKELILHLGWHHRKTPPHGMGKPALIALHNKLLEATS